MSLPVNCFAEWHPLEEIIVGRIGPMEIDTTDISFRLFFHDNLVSSDLLSSPSYIPPQKVIDECQEDLDALSLMLEKLGIIVLRPEECQRYCEPFVSPHGWMASSTPPYNLRDQTLVYGQAIIETPSLVRARLYENDWLKTHFYRYFLQGATWISAPKPRLRDGNFDSSSAEQGMATTDHEMMIDAAQCLRFGQDILVNVSNKNHKLGARWLQTVLPEARFHEVTLVESHIDATLLPLRPGVLLVDKRKIPHIDLLPPPLRRWDLIELNDEDFDQPYELSKYALASSALSMNVLSIDDTRIIVNSAATSIMRKLEKHHFTPIPVRFRHGRLFGGGIHCATLDIRRSGECEAYF